MSVLLKIFQKLGDYDKGRLRRISFTANSLTFLDTLAVVIRTILLQSTDASRALPSPAASSDAQFGHGPTGTADRPSQSLPPPQPTEAGGTSPLSGTSVPGADELSHQPRSEGQPRNAVRSTQNDLLQANDLSSQNNSGWMTIKRVIRRQTRKGRP